MSFKRGITSARAAFGRATSTAFSGPPHVKAAKVWVAAGAATGGFYSGAIKFCQICDEPSRKYRIPEVEGPIQCVYSASIIAAHSGWGAAIGGIAAATAPVSMPIYFMVFQYDDVK